MLLVVGYCNEFWRLPRLWRRALLLNRCRLGSR